MKKVLFATTALVMMAGAAAAEINLTGDARMGVITEDGDWAFTSRARVRFEASGTTDNGLEFGFRFRAHQAVGAANGTNGDVFISGAFGKISMGDVDGAAQSAVGQVDGVGLTGLSDLNEIDYLLGDDDPSMTYEYSAGQLTFYLSADNPGATVAAGPNLGDGEQSYGVGAKYATDTFSVALGYETTNDAVGLGADADHIVVGASATFSDITVKAVYGTSGDIGDEDQYALSVSGSFSGVGVTAYFSEDFLGDNYYGLGASYDLGGGASIVGGVVDGDGLTDPIADFGVSFSF